MAGLIGSIIGSGQQSSDDAQAQATQAAALAALQNINVPTVQSEELKLALEQNAGQLSPESEGTEQIGSNALNNVTTDPRLAAAQMGALQSLQQQGTSGLTASDKANLQQIENQASQQAASQNAGTLQQFAQRGQAGSGASLAAQLMNNQNASNTANQRSLQVAGQAQQNALQATAAAGNLGQSMQGQQYGEAANAAQAQNAINQFNTQNSQAVLGTNTQAQNQAQAYNLNNAQGISNTNTGIQNQQQQYNSQLQQQNFEDQVQKAGGVASESNNLAGTQMQTGENAYQNTQNTANAAGQSAGQAAQLFAYGGMVKGYDDGGNVEDWGSLSGDNGGGSANDAGPSLLASLAAAGSSANGSSPTGSSGSSFQQKLGGLLSGSSVPSGGASSGSNPISDLLAKLKGGSNAGNAQSFGLKPQATQANNYGASNLQMPGLSTNSSTPSPSGLSLPQLGQSQNGPQQAPTLMSKGGMARPPIPGNASSMFRMLSHGGNVTSVKLSPGEELLTPNEVTKVEQGKMSPKSGIKVPGKAKVKGDSPKNDTFNTEAPVNSLVIPRTIIGQPDNVIMDFIKAAKKHANGGK